MLKRTPLFAAHKALGARLVEFGGWEMPLQYTGIVDEHHAVRTAAGMFDISHMGEVRVVGAAARDFLNRVLTNDVGRLRAGQGQYTLMCNERGGVVDDLYVYCLAAREFLLVINAARIEADVAWLQRQHDAFTGRNSVLVENVSDFLGAVAVQGPVARKFIDGCFTERASGGTLVARPGELKKNQVAAFREGGTVAWVACTGYTGEDGFELIAPNILIVPLWERLLVLGRPHGLKPCGLGARDTLRMEMCYPLYGHELNEETTPIEAGLGYFVALEKGEFVGREALAAQRAKGVSKKLVAFKLGEKSPPPRPGYPIWSAGNNPAKIGQVTSGTQSPSLGVGIGLGYVSPQFAAAGTWIDIEIRGKRAPAVVVQKPIYRKNV